MKLKNGNNPHKDIVIREEEGKLNEKLSVEDFDKSPAFPRWFICLVLIVSFCFVGDNIFRPGVRWDHHLHPLSQATKSFPSKPENLSNENQEILGKGKSEKSCAGRVANPVEENLGKSGTARSTAVISFFKIEITSADLSISTIWEMQKNLAIQMFAFWSNFKEILLYQVFPSLHIFMLRCCKGR